MLRRIAWMKWFRPMPYPSPSPPVAMTVMPWLASLAPVANGRARPCRLCTPYARKKPGRFDDQPIARLKIYLGTGLEQRVQDPEVPAPRTPVGRDCRLEVFHSNFFWSDYGCHTICDSPFLCRGDPCGRSCD